MSYIDPRKVQLAEKDIEDWLFLNPASLKVSKWAGRQVHVPSGIIDLLGVSYLGKKCYPLPIVVEVKNVEVSPAAILQVCRYAQDVKSIIEAVHARDDDFPEVQCRKILVFKGDVHTELLYASHALDVELRSFDVELNLKISGYWHFSSEKREEDKELISRLSNSEMFTGFQFINEVDPEQP